MCIIEIQIRKNSNGNLSAYYSPNGTALIPLFELAYRKDDYGNGKWLFWLNGERFPAKFEGKRKDFPMRFFVDACRAKYFIRYQAEMPADIQITHGHGHIGMKKQ